MRKKQIDRCYKVPKNEKEGKTKLECQKKRKREKKKAEEQAQQEAKVPTSPETAKKRTETKKNCGKREL